MSDRPIVIGPCGFTEFSDSIAVECGRMGRRLTVLEPITGHLSVIVRCRHHSDWIQAPAHASGVREHE